MIYSRIARTEVCFPAGTLVHTKEGLRPIEQIKRGDLVLTRSEHGYHDGETCFQPVLQSFVTKPTELLTINYQQANGQSGTLTSTPNHEFYNITSQTWKPIREFQEGDVLCLGRRKRGQVSYPFFSAS